jgi:hypothetical protein
VSINDAEGTPVETTGSAVALLSWDKDRWLQPLIKWFEYVQAVQVSGIEDDTSDPWGFK